MKTIHRLTGIFVSIFIVAHLYNHCMAMWGISTHQSILEALRRIYRIPIIEILLIGAFLFQSISGIQLFLKLRKKANKTKLERVKMYSGLILGLFVIQHISATVGQRLYFGFDTNFYFASRVVIEDPWFYFFIPYYFLGVMSFGFHLASIHKEKISKFVNQKQATIHFVFIILLFFVISLFILYIFTGGFYEIVIPDEYNVY